MLNLKIRAMCLMSADTCEDIRNPIWCWMIFFLSGILHKQFWKKWRLPEAGLCIFKQKCELNTCTAVAHILISICGHQAHWSDFQPKHGNFAKFLTFFDFFIFFKNLLKYIYLSRGSVSKIFWKMGASHIFYRIY